MSKELIGRLREAAALRVGETAMLSADDLIAAANELYFLAEERDTWINACNQNSEERDAVAAERDALTAELQKAKGDRDIWAAEHERQIEEKRALAAELKALEPKCPSYMPDWPNHGAAIADPVFQQIRGIMGTQNFGQDDALRQAVLHALRTFESSPKPGAFRLGDLVKKVSGSAWEGRIVGTYSTALTPEGYAVESASHPGSVQIYPAKALTLVIQEAGIQPTEGQHAQYVNVSGANVNATFRISKQTGADALVGLRGCNSRHGGMRAVEPCGYRMRTTDPGCTGCADRDEDQPTKAGDSILGEQK